MKTGQSLIIVAAFALLASVIPLTNVSAHVCESPYREYGGNSDQGCDSGWCPGNEGTQPHSHTNYLGLSQCSSPSSCHPEKKGNGEGQANGGGGPGTPSTALRAPAPDAGRVLLKCHKDGGGPSTLSDNCPHSSPHSHSYLTGGSAGGRSDAASTGDFGAGLTTVTDTNVVDCNGDGVPGDFDGDYESGVGGGFFGHGPWGDEPLCNFGLSMHGPTVTVNDVVFGSAVWFVIGADDTNGPDLTPDPVTGEPACTTDGSITPGDPRFDPTADGDDCLTAPGTGSVTTCGAGGDGGYWVFLGGVHVTEEGGEGEILCALPEPALEPVNDEANSFVGGGILPLCLGNPGGVGISNSPTSGTLTA